VSWPFGLEESFLTIELLLTNGMAGAAGPFELAEFGSEQMPFPHRFRRHRAILDRCLRGVFATLGWATMPHVHFGDPAWHDSVGRDAIFNLAATD